MQLFTRFLVQRTSNAPTIEAENATMAALYKENQCIVQGLAEEAPDIVNYAHKYYDEHCANRFLEIKELRRCREQLNKIASTVEIYSELSNPDNDTSVIKDNLINVVPEAFKETFKLAKASDNKEGTEKLLSMKQRCKAAVKQELRLEKERARTQKKQNVTRDYYDHGL